MRNICLSIFCLLQASFSHGQDANSMGMRDDFAQAARYGNRQGGFEILRGHSAAVRGSQFFYPDWHKGSVVTKSREVLSDKFLYLFDKVRQELFMRLPDSNDIYLANKGEILTFTLNTDRPHTFEIASDYDPGRTADFFEILVKNDKYTLLKSTKTTFVKFDPHDMLRVRNGEIYDEFVDEYTYYFSLRGGPLQTISLRAADIKKMLSAEKSKVADYFENNAEEEINEKFLGGLIGFLNS
jgi:hypothetical protein